MLAPRIATFLACTAAVVYGMFGPAEEALDREALLASQVYAVRCFTQAMIAAGEAELRCEACAPSPGGCESTALKRGVSSDAFGT